MKFIGAYPTFDHAYFDILLAIDRYGVEFHPRGFTCKELRPASFDIMYGRSALYTRPDRQLNYRFFAVEVLGYLAGLDANWYADLLIMSNKNIATFRNVETGRFDGAYGPKLKQSLVDVRRLLRDDPSSRQAVSAIWSPGIPKNSLDVPCTVALQFYNDGRMDKPSLGCLATMRSNDINWGTPYDVAAFATIQCAIAGSLGWDVGRYCHSAGSLHVYVDNAPKLINPDTDEIDKQRHGDLPLSTAKCLNALANECEMLLKALYDHRSSDGKWSEFGYNVTLNKEYFDWWIHLIRKNALPSLVDMAYMKENR